MGENRMYIFSHPEFGDEVAGLFDEYLGDFRDLPNDSGFEKRTGLGSVPAYWPPRRAAR